MTTKPATGFYPIRGKVTPGQMQNLFSYVDIVIQAVEEHLVSIGMREVHLIPPDLIAFNGSTGKPLPKSDFGLEENIDNGIIRICTEGSTVVARYYVGFLGRFSIRWFVPVGLISLLAFFETGIRFLVLPLLAVALVIPLLVTVFVIRWGMKKELLRAFQVAASMIEKQG